MSRPLNGGPSSEHPRRRALDRTNDPAIESFDRAIKRIFGSSLTLASVLRRPGIDDHTHERLGDVIDELDHTVTELRSAAFEIAVPVARSADAVFNDLESNIPLHVDESRTDRTTPRAANAPRIVESSRTLGEITT